MASNVPPKPRLTKEVLPGEKSAKWSGRTAAMKPINSKAPTVGMKDDSKLLAKLPVTQAHLNAIKRHYGI